MKTKLLFLNVALFLSSLIGYSQFATIALTGDGVGGWTNNPPASNFLTTTDGITYTKQNFEITGSGGAAQLKFITVSSPPAWNDFGITAPQAGGWPTDTANGGTNIQGVAGWWNVTLNLTTKAYTFSPGVSPFAVISLNSSGTPISLSTTDGITYRSSSVTLNAGNFTFAQAGSPNVWGSVAFPTGTATAGGTPIAAQNGTYNITFNKNTGAYSFVATPVGIIGAGGPGASWADSNPGSDVVMNTVDAINYTLNGAVCPGGELKFRDNKSWAFNWGGANNTVATSGTGVLNSGTNIFIPAGTFNVSFNRTTKAYNFSAAASVSQFVQENFYIMPNPTSTMWNVNAKNNAITNIQVFDVVGKLVFSKNVNALEYAIDATNFTKGVYVAKIATVDGSGSIKLVRN